VPLGMLAAVKVASTLFGPRFAWIVVNCEYVSGPVPTRQASAASTSAVSAFTRSKVNVNGMTVPADTPAMGPFGSSVRRATVDS